MSARRRVLTIAGQVTRPLGAMREAIYRHRFAGNWPGTFYGAFASFDDAIHAAPKSKSIGYDQPALAKMYRDRMTRAMPSDYPVLFWLSKIMRPGLRIFDFGGHVGVSFHCFERYLDYPSDLTWTVCDVPAVVEEGAALAKERGKQGTLSFTTRFEDADGCDVVLAAGSLQYVDEHIWDKLARLRRPPSALLVSKLPVHDGATFITLQNTGNAFPPLPPLEPRGVRARRLESRLPQARRVDERRTTLLRAVSRDEHPCVHRVLLRDGLILLLRIFHRIAIFRQSNRGNATNRRGRRDVRHLSRRTTRLSSISLEAHIAAASPQSSRCRFSTETSRRTRSRSATVKLRRHIHCVGARPTRRVLSRVHGVWPRSRRRGARDLRRDAARPNDGQLRHAPRIGRIAAQSQFVGVRVTVAVTIDTDTPAGAWRRTRERKRRGRVPHDGIEELGRAP